MEHNHHFNQLLNAQQRELDSALVFQALSRKAKEEKDAFLFKSVATKDIEHAAVFHSLTQEDLRPKKLFALLIPALFTLLGRKRIIPLLAMYKYLVHQRYDVLGRKYNRLKQICSEEKKQGQQISALLY